jgi:uroporphyrinogen decarboxylase
MHSLTRVRAALAGRPVDRRPALPILHSGLPPLFDVPLGTFYTDAEVMADVIVRGYRTFGYDGVQLSLGVTGEAEALGADVAQPEDGAPVLQAPLLTDFPGPESREQLGMLRTRDPTTGGRMPLYYEAVRRTVGRIGEEAFVLAMLRGPLLAASQLCGVEDLLIAMITAPDAVTSLLAFTTDVAQRLGMWLRASGAHGLMLGEATCSPNFISPAMYRSLVHPYHRTLVAGLREAGWDTLGLHVCGDITPIVEDLTATGVDLLDVDHQVDAEAAVERAENRVALRGNLDPSRIFRFGTPAQVRRATRALMAQVADAPRWILGSGCDIPPGTPEANLRAWMETVVSPNGDQKERES